MKLYADNHENREEYTKTMLFASGAIVLIMEWGVVPILSFLFGG